MSAWWLGLHGGDPGFWRILLTQSLMILCDSILFQSDSWRGNFIRSWWQQMQMVHQPKAQSKNIVDQSSYIYRYKNVDVCTPVASRTKSNFLLCSSYPPTTGPLKCFDLSDLSLDQFETPLLCFLLGLMCYNLLSYINLEMRYLFVKTQFYYF